MIGYDLVRDIFVNKANSIVQVLKRVPKDSYIPLADILLDKKVISAQCRGCYKISIYF